MKNHKNTTTKPTSLPRDIDVEINTLAFRFTSATQIERVDGETAYRELLRRLCTVTAVRVKAVDDDKHTAGRLRRPPSADKDVETSDAFETFLVQHVEE